MNHSMIDLSSPIFHLNNTRITATCYRLYQLQPEHISIDVEVLIRVQKNASANAVFHL